MTELVKQLVNEIEGIEKTYDINIVYMLSISSKSGLVCGIKVFSSQKKLNDYKAKWIKHYSTNKEKCTDTFVERMFMIDDMDMTQNGVYSYNVLRFEY